MEKIDNIEDLHEEVFMHLYEKTISDPDFRFSIRKSDKENRLSKGYYFYGNDSYLAISFWSGTNWKNKTPNIILVFIPEDDTAYLEITVSDSDEKTDFVEKFLLKSRLELEPKKGKYYKAYYKETFIKIVDDFLNEDKKLIDNIIKDNQSFFKEADLEHRLGFIDPDLFKFRLAKALEYRQKKLLQIVDEYPPYLSELKVNLFCGIDDLEIKDLPNNTQWIFFTGVNGSGKTSILRALTMALCHNVIEYFEIEDSGHFKIEVSLHRGNNKVNILSEAGNLPTYNFALAKGFAAYGASRLMTSDFRTKQKISPKELNRRQSSSYSIFNSDGILLDFATEIDKLIHQTGDIKSKEKLNIIIETLIECIDPLDNIFVELKKDNEQNEDTETLFVEKDEDGNKFQPVKYFQISSGTKSLIAMIGDMMIRLFREQPDVYDLGQLKGIVLIDEIDIHFHPKQQKNLVEALTNSFPKVQFIVTTHSPIPLLGAPENSVFLSVNRTVKKGVTVEKLNIDIKNLLPNTILTSPIFDFINITSVNHKKGKEKIITESLYQEVIKNKEHLVVRLG